MPYEQYLMIGVTSVICAFIVWAFVFAILMMTEVEYDLDFHRHDQVVNLLNETKGGDWYYDVAEGHYADSLTDRTHKDES